MNRFNAAYPWAPRWGGFLLSSCIHAALLLVLWFMPQPMALKVNLDLSAMNLSRVTISAPQTEEPQAAAPEESVPIMPSVEPDPAAPDEPEEFTPVAQPLSPVDPEPGVPLPEPDLAAALPVPESAPTRQVPKPAAPAILSAEALLQAAMEEARRGAAPLPGISGNRSALNRALSEALNAAPREKEANPINGEGDGIGYYGIYLESVISRIRPHFTTPPRSDGKVLEMLVRLEIAEDGSVTKVTVLRSSKDSAFDANVLRAIREAGKMEPPGKEEAHRLEILFNSRFFLGG